jgi:5,10-methylenetetrahydromethanopterin reductase
MKFDIGILANQPVETIVRQVQLAESLGYHTAWIADSHLVCRELYVTLTACVLGTKRIRLGPGVTVPHTRHVSVTASAMVSVHELAPGRIVLGVGTGDSSAGTLGLKMEKVARVATLESMTHALRRLTAADSLQFESGAQGRIAWLDRPHAIPLYVAGSGPKMLAAAGRLGDGVIMYSSTSPPIIEAALSHIAAGAQAAGKALEELNIVIWAPMSVAHDRALARDHVRGRVASAMRHPLPIELDAEDRAAVERVRRQYDFFQHATAASTHRELVPERFVDLLALAGNPDEIVERVRAIEKIPQISRIVVLPQVPGESFIEREYILRLFAAEVMARVA